MRLCRASSNNVTPAAQAIESHLRFVVPAG
jgi:hypothetical protein